LSFHVLLIGVEFDKVWWCWVFCDKFSSI